MIDIHTHILPGIDDGAADWEDTLAMAHAAVAEGIKTVIATPHHANGSYMNEADGVRRLAAEVNERLMLEGVPLTILAGQEIRVHDDLLEAWSRKELLTLADSNYLLLEMPFSSIPRGMADFIHELRILGVRPIIAHPERTAEVMKYPERYAELIEAGAYGQVTTHSLLGSFGRKAEQAAWELCRSGLIHLVASDAHHVTRRGFYLLEAYRRIEQEMGKDWRNYYYSNAEAISKDLDFPIKPARSVVKRKNIFNLFGIISHK